MSDAPPPPESKPYRLAFLTDQWEWEVDFAAPSLEAAQAASRQALEDLVRDERPALACATLFAEGVRIGVWDWVGGAAHWTRL